MRIDHYAQVEIVFLLVETIQVAHLRSVDVIENRMTTRPVAVRHGPHVHGHADPIPRVVA
ncbi:hypothetical protein D3C71_1639260 [compost metagenome]